MVITLENEALAVQVNSLGAELWSLRDKAHDTEHLWQGDPAVWAGRSPTLFPICGRLKNGAYTLEGKRYEMLLHGFARQLEHQLVEQTATTVVFRLTESPETLAQYPFSFQLDTRFVLEGRKLHYSFEVVNTGEAVLPFSIGYHTGLRIPFGGTGSAAEYSLTFEKGETVISLTEENLLTGVEQSLAGDTMPLCQSIFPGSVILEGMQSKAATLTERGTGRSLVVAFDAPFMVIWSGAKEVPFICLEPWYGLPDDPRTNGEFLTKRGLKLLEAGERFSFGQSIEPRG